MMFFISNLCPAQSLDNLIINKFVHYWSILFRWVSELGTRDNCRDNWMDSCFTAIQLLIVALSLCTIWQLSFDTENLK